MIMACLPTKPLNSVKEKGFYGTARYVVEVEVMDHYCMYIGFYRDTRGQRKGHKWI